MAIEEIVKLNVPFTGTYKDRKIDTKRRFIVPTDLRRIYELRQGKKSFTKCVAFIARGKFPVIATMTDNPSTEEYSDYNLVILDEQGRVGASFDMPLDIPKHRKIDFIGHGDYIEIRASNDNYQSSSTL